MRRWLAPGIALAVTAGLSAGPAAISDRTDVQGFFDLEVTGGAAGYDALGLRPDERGMAMSMLARALYRQGTNGPLRPPGANRPMASEDDQPATTSSDAGPRVTVAAPLRAAAWRSALDLPEDSDLFSAIVANRSALLVCAGAMATDASVRALLDRDDGLLRWLVRNAPAGFAQAARSLRLERNRVRVPGGASSEPAWESLAAERVDRPADFIRAIASRDAGRLAWFFDTLASLPPERLALALPEGPPAVRLARARELYTSFRSADQNWHLEDHPFLRGVADPWLVVTSVGVRDGAVAPPASTWMWRALFDRDDLTRRDAAGLVRGGDPAPVNLSWLAQEVATATPRERRDRFEMLRFAQRAFSRARDEEAIDVLVALGGYRRFRTALLALERMDVATPAVYARAIDAARRIDARPRREQRHALVALQAALALIERARLSRAIDVTTAEALVRSLADSVDRDGPIPEAVAEWIVSRLVPALPPLVVPDAFTTRTAYESTILQAMAGPPSEPAPVVTWETLPYDVDLAAADRSRIQRIRKRLVSPGLDQSLPPGHADDLCAALMVLVYSATLGDPDGPALLSRDLPSRHDFGIEAAAGSKREVMAWMPPRELVGDGGPWRIQGSLLGLDLGLARLSLRRISDDQMPAAPSINLNDELTLARTAVSLNPRDLTEADRQALVDALARGRQRVADAGRNLPALLALADEAHVSMTLRQLLPWMVARAPESLRSMFSMRDLLWLGTPALAEERLDRWGVHAEPLDGRWRTMMPAPAPWEDFAGRADTGVMATQVPDLTLRLAEETARLALPARLIPALLTYATQDYWHDVTARFPDDWPAMSRQAEALSPSRVEDYVAALAGDGPLRPH